jgi:hypothetical protein
MFVIFNESADGIAETAEWKIDFFGFLQAFSLYFAFENFLASSQID